MFAFFKRTISMGDQNTAVNDAPLKNRDKAVQTDKVDRNKLKSRYKVHRNLSSVHKNWVPSLWTIAEETEGESDKTAIEGQHNEACSGTAKPQFIIPCIPLNPHKVSHEQNNWIGNIDNSLGLKHKSDFMVYQCNNDVAIRNAIQTNAMFNPNFVRKNCETVEIDHSNILNMASISGAINDCIDEMKTDDTEQGNHSRGKSNISQIPNEHLPPKKKRTLYRQKFEGPFKKLKLTPKPESESKIDIGVQVIQNKRTLGSQTNPFERYAELLHLPIVQLIRKLNIRQLQAVNAFAQALSQPVNADQVISIYRSQPRFIFLP